MLHVCFPTFTINVGKMQANVPYMDHLGIFGTMKLNCILDVLAPDFVSSLQALWNGFSSVSVHCCIRRWI